WPSILQCRMPDTRRPPRPSPATLVLLVRHGQTSTTGVILPGRAPGLHLSDDGRRQAEAVATRLAGIKHIAAVDASPLERPRETAAAVAHALGIHLDLFQRIVIATGSITAIAYRRESPAILTVNSVNGELGALGIR